MEHAQTFNVYKEVSETSDIVHHLEELTGNTTHVVILWAPFYQARLIMDGAEQRNINRKNLVFIGRGESI